MGIETREKSDLVSSVSWILYQFKDYNVSCDNRGYQVLISITMTLFPLNFTHFFIFNSVSILVKDKKLLPIVNDASNLSVEDVNRTMWLSAVPVFMTWTYIVTVWPYWWPVLVIFRFQLLETIQFMKSIFLEWIVLNADLVLSTLSHTVVWG